MGNERVQTPRRYAALMVLSSIAVVLAIAELSLRIRHGDLFGAPALPEEVRVVGGTHPALHHSRLGYVPEPGASRSDNPWGAQVTITSDGVRSNGAAPPPGTPILAVGDSFTYGDGVSDADTWPAQLERISGRPVVNGGVFGYGFDQIVLRAEQLLEHHPSDLLLVALIPDDVRRTEFAYRYAWKPYFERVDGELALRNVPVPRSGQRPREAGWRRLLRRSFLADWIFLRIDPGMWLLPATLRVHDEGERVSRLLVDRLATLARARGIELLVILLWGPNSPSDPILAVSGRAEEQGIGVLDLEPLLREIAGPRRAGMSHLFRIHGHRPGHMTPEGNALVADSVARDLRRRGWLREGPEGD